jgi:hypothetical protein
MLLAARALGFGRNVDDPLPEILRRKSRSGARSPAGLAFVCAIAGGLSDGPVRAGPPDRAHRRRRSANAASTLGMTNHPMPSPIASSSFAVLDETWRNWASQMKCTIGIDGSMRPATP